MNRGYQNYPVRDAGASQKTLQGPGLSQLRALERRWVSFRTGNTLQETLPTYQYLSSLPTSTPKEI